MPAARSDFERLDRKDRAPKLDEPEFRPKTGGKVMAVARVTELISASRKSFEDAIQVGVSRAVKTLKNVEGVWVANQKCVIKNGKIAEYRVNLKVTFILAD
jgi:flavin-binding protein dodecin